MKHSSVAVRFICIQTVETAQPSEAVASSLTDQYGVCVWASWSTSGCPLGTLCFQLVWGGRDGTDTVMETTPLQLHNTNVTSAKDAASTSHTPTHTLFPGEKHSLESPVCPVCVWIFAVR